MSRSGYSDYVDGWALIRWRGAVASALRGKRGQSFLRETLAALDALPKPELIPNNLAAEGAFCTLGAVGRARGQELNGVDVYDHESVAALFGVPHALACEIMWENDDGGPYHGETPRARWERMRRWIVAALHDDLPSEPTDLKAEDA
jgi:hypothetical protein